MIKIKNPLTFLCCKSKPKLQEKSIVFDENGNYSVIADTELGYDGLSKVDIKVDILSDVYSGLIDGSLEKFTMPNDKTVIAPYRFYNFINLKSVGLSNVISIGESAFSGCVNLEAIVIPESAISIGANAFLDCNSLRAVVVLSHIPPILENAVTFSGNHSERLFYVPDNAIVEYKTALYWSAYADFFVPLSQLPDNLMPLIINIGIIEAYGVDTTENNTLLII